MKLLKSLLFLFVLVLGLSSCGDDVPSTTPVTGTQWQLRNLRNYSSTGRTTIDVRLSFERNGRVVINIGYGSVTNQSNGSGSSIAKREQETTLSSTYRYYNGQVRINPATMSALTEQILKGTEIAGILQQLYTDATLNEQKTLLTFYPFDNDKRFSLQRVGR